MMTGAVHSSPEVRVRLAEATDTDALVLLINEAFAVEKLVIEGERIDPKGFGGNKPLVSPSQKGAAAINDRVELIILERR